MCHLFLIVTFSANQLRFLLFLHVPMVVVVCCFFFKYCKTEGGTDFKTLKMYMNYETERCSVY